jgi:hypothetical protein
MDEALGYNGLFYPNAPFSMNKFCIDKMECVQSKAKICLIILLGDFLTSRVSLIGMIMSAHLIPVLHGKRYTTTYPVRLKPISTPSDIFKPGAISRCSFVEAAS